MNDPANPNNDPIPAHRDRAALGWFSLGVLVGAVAVIGLFVLNGSTRPATSGTIDLNAVREAARQGAADALLSANTGITTPLSLNDIRDAARQGAQEAIANSVKPDSGNALAPTPTAAPINMADIQINPTETVGSANAKITLIEYADFQCPFCKRFNDSVLPQIMSNYVQTGKIRFSYKHYAFLGEESDWAAEAAECAADQGKFWPYHDMLFAQQGGENSGTFTKDKLISAAAKLNLDSTQFAVCLNQDKTLPRVQADIDEGNRIGVRGTPSFLLNGKLIVGAQPYAAFKAALDAALK